MLEILDVSRSFGRGEAPVLDHLSLTIGKSEFVSLIGPSGCGKTTLLRIVAGLLEPGSGEVRLLGKPSPRPSREKGIVFQHFNLLPWRTAIDNVAYGLELQGVSKTRRRSVAQEYLDLVGLRDYGKHFPAELSGGMKQRVGLARALAIEPKLLLMDEPFGALDALTRERLQAELERISIDRKLSTLFVTHSIDEAILLSDRIVVMGSRPGRILKTFDVSMKRPRASYNFRAEPSYAEMREEIWALLQSEVGIG